MTWKPTEGLRRGEPIAYDIAAELKLAGLVVEPLYQWRMAQVIGRAIDDALAEGAQPALDLGPEAPPVSAYENGGGMPEPDPAYQLGTVAESDNRLQAVVDAAVDLGQQIEKRKRGRPKGSGKKAKPGRKPKADPIEAVAEALKEGGP